MEFIILAGGLGTRLQGVIGDHPKCMAPISGQPFLSYLFKYLTAQNCSRVILSLGHRSKSVLDWLRTAKPDFRVDFVIETEALGTGGGIQLAMREAKEENACVINGDTMFQTDIKNLLAFHERRQAEATLALKEMQNFDRYGIVNIDTNGCINSFEEKKERAKGLINGGVYILNRQEFLARELPEQFSFEKHYLEKFISEKKFYGMPCDDYFIDIGIPQDYQQAQEDFKIQFR